MHAVSGVEYYGLLLDPGASKGIIGSDVLNKIINYVLAPLGKDQDIVWVNSAASFSGISSSVETSLGLISFPIGLQGLRTARFQADVIGGGSSQCPGLMPLYSLIASSALVSFGCFHNGDGIICILDASSGRMCPQRLYHTDSSPYLLPIEFFDSKVDERLVDFMTKNITYRLSINPSPSKGKGKRQPKKPVSKGHNVFLLFDIANNDNHEIINTVTDTEIVKQVFRQVLNKTVNYLIQTSMSTTTEVSRMPCYTKSGSRSLALVGKNKDFFQTTSLQLKQQ